MCTVTLIPLAGDDASKAGSGYRLLTNRDESRQRRPALPPHTVEVRSGDASPRHAIAPTDADAGGTWIAVTTAGLTATLLNANPPGLAPHERPRGRRSRGELIAKLWGEPDAARACDALGGIDASDYAPFRLVVTDGQRVGECRGDTKSLAIALSPTGDRPRLWTSSGLGDHVVEPPRRELFEGWFSADPSAWPAEQDAFHRQCRPDRGELGVCMAREDARTVSLTAVEVHSRAVRMTYHAGPPCEAAEDFDLELPR